MTLSHYPMTVDIFKGSYQMQKTWHSLREYQALRATLSTGTTTAAGRQLGLTQSAISRSLASLEARQGVLLFVREAGRLIPTDEALRLDERLDGLFDVLTKIDKSSNPPVENLRIVAPFTIARHVIVPTIASFRTANPNMFMAFGVGTSDDVVNRLLENRSDLGFTGIRLERRGIKLIPFRRSKAVVVLPMGHDLATKEKITIDDLIKQDLVALTQRHPGRHQLEKIAKERGIKLKIIIEISTATDAIRLVQDGLGIAVLNPFPVLQKPVSGLEIRELDAPITYCTYFAMSDQRALSRAARAFLQHVRLFTPADQYSQKA